MTTKALVNATAPYNFVPFHQELVIPAFKDEERKWSGQIVCRLTAKTPLLVCGKQEKANEDAPSECRFMQANGKYVIPGTSIKGMLRSLMQIMTFSNMLPVSKEHLVWRRVEDPNKYRPNFDSDKPHGGFLRKIGAEYYLTPVEVIACKKNARGPGQGWIRVKTGGFKNFRTGVESCEYYFRQPGKEVQKKDQIASSLVHDFWAQLTPDQEKRWGEGLRNNLLQGKSSSNREGTTYPALPVFFRWDENNILELGFCRYFRLKYEYSPHELAFPKEPIPDDFVSTLFGRVGRHDEGVLKGRVAVEAAWLKDGAHNHKDFKAVLSSPKPTCLPLYIRQNPQAVKTIAYGSKNAIGDMKNYNDRDAQLRGFKLYWHHDVDESLFPGQDMVLKKQYKVVSCLYPLRKGVSASFVIHVDHLTSTELGALFEALELPGGHAHKLGMGKSLGLGSVRLDIEKARVFDIRKAHSSLAARLETPAPEMNGKERAELRELFRQRMLNAVREKLAALGNKKFQEWRGIDSYDKLPPIKTLRIMMDFEQKPTPEQVRTMPLSQFRKNAILPIPEQVIRQAAGAGRQKSGGK